MPLKPPGGICDTSAWCEGERMRWWMEGGREGGLMAYPSWVSSEGRWVGRRVERRHWTWCPLAACGAFHSPPPTETESSSETEGSWCLWMCRRWISMRITASPKRNERRLNWHCLSLFVLRRSWFQATTRWQQRYKCLLVKFTVEKTGKEPERPLKCRREDFFSLNPQIENQRWQPI